MCVSMSVCECAKGAPATAKPTVGGRRARTHALTRQTDRRDGEREGLIELVTERAIE